MIIRKTNMMSFDEYYALVSLIDNNYGIYIMTDKDNFNIIEKYKRKFKDTVIDYDTSNITNLSNKTSDRTSKYSLIVFDSNNEYVISTAEKLRTYTKRLAVKNNKNITTLYKYNNKGVTEAKILYATPSYEKSEACIFEYKDVKINSLMDLVAFKHSENNYKINIPIKRL